MPYKGARKFNKHYFPIIGDLKPEGEEFRCAVFLDENPSVRFWVRNVDRKPNDFGSSYRVVVFIPTS